jgi:anti-sigma regulatory factor (Ser/Thr protein kinase)
MKDRSTSQQTLSTYPRPGQSHSASSTTRGLFCITEYSVESLDTDNPYLQEGLKPYGLFDDQWQQYFIQHDAEAANVLTILDSFLGRSALPRTQAFKVAYTEALTNALYHAQGRAKGSVSDNPLPSAIHCELGFDDQYLYGSVRDQQGQLSAQLITKYIEAAQEHSRLCPLELENTTGGRGLFLMATLIQDVQIIISPGQFTEIRLKQPRHISSLRLGGQCFEIITVGSPEAV